MVKKKESKKSSVQETKQVEGNNNIFDTNGKLILKQKDEINVEEQQPPDTPIKKKKQSKTKITSEEESQKMKRAAWRKYYSDHKEKYKQWNKNWREKQKQKKSADSTKKMKK